MVARDNVVFTSFVDTTVGVFNARRSPIKFILIQHIVGTFSDDRRNKAFGVFLYRKSQVDNAKHA